MTSARLSRTFSLSQYPRCNPDPTSEGYRYTEWVQWNGSALKPVWENQVGVELYDHQNDDEADFDAFENENVASNNADVVKMLSQQQLHKLLGY